MNYFVYFAVLILGLIIGSFINCIVYRLHIKKSFFHGRSFCPQCKKQINWYDNIPLLSYLFLKAKCRYCKKKISIQYPLVELITGILFLVIFITEAANFDFNVLMFSYLNVLMILRNWLFTSILIIIFLYDLKYYLILDKVAIPAMVIALIFNVIICSFQQGAFNLFSCFLVFLFSCFLASGFFLLQFVISRGRWIGGGDIRLGALMGFMLGWPNILAALVMAYIFGSIIGVFLIILKKKTMKSQIPFGTFLTVSTFIALLWGQQIIDWYLGITF